MPLRKRGQRSRRPLPVSRGEDAVVSRPSRPRLLQVLRLRCRRRRHHVRAEGGEPDVRRRRPRARGQSRHRARAREPARGPRAQRARGDLRSQPPRRRLLRAHARRAARIARREPTANGAASRRRRSSDSASATRPTRGTASSTSSSAHGVELALAAKAGLLKRGQRGYYDFYRNRLMVPTYSTTGEVIAFGGRALGDAEPKYLNTATTPVYTKGHHLFALNLARRAAQSRSHDHRGRGLPRLHRAPPSRLRERGRRAWAPRSPRSKRPSFASTPTTCFSASTATRRAARPQPKPSTWRLRVIEDAGSSVRIVVLPAGRGSRQLRSDARCRRRSSACSTMPSRRLRFRIDAEIDRLRAGFDTPARAGAEGGSARCVRWRRARNGTAGAFTSRGGCR